MSIQITRHIFIPEAEVECTAIRASGSGGQNVNKVSSAIHLRFDIKNSSLPSEYKEILLVKNDHRVNKNGVIIIKAQEHRTQEKNREAAIHRLVLLIQSAGLKKKARKATRPTKASKIKRLESKTRKSRTKLLRKKVVNDD